MYSILTTALCLSLASMAIYACDPDYVIAAKFCESDVVFIGEPVSGNSGLSMDENGVSHVHQITTFQVSEYYKNNDDDVPVTVDVTRTYTEADYCDEAFLPDSDGPYLVLASGGNHLSVPTCGYVIPSQCVSSDLQNVSC